MIECGEPRQRPGGCRARGRWVGWLRDKGAGQGHSHTGSHQCTRTKGSAPILGRGEQFHGVRAIVQPGVKYSNFETWKM